MQYQVPQFIDIEDRIIGPLTLKQFLYLAFAAALLFVFWFLLKFYIWIIVALPITAASLAFAFVKINDRPFVYFFLAAVSYFIKPKLYIFSTVAKIRRSEEIGAPTEALEKIKPQPMAEKVTKSSLKELAMNLDIGNGRLNNQL